MTLHPILAGKTYAVHSLGCQMNLHDGERVCGVLDACGCIPVSSDAEADIVVFMTCSVREKADTHLYGQASNVVSLPDPPSGRRILVIGGCIAQRDGEILKRRVRNVNVIFGTAAISEVPRLLEEALLDESAVAVDTREEGRGFSTDLPSHRAQQFHAWVPIMTGCNNFCTYCIVPYVRGREKSRVLERVVGECEALVADGVREICLLGQNVNSYGKTLYGKPEFARLLRAVADTGVERLRFTSSNPKDLGDDIIAAMAECPAVMPHLHLAVQSGSNKVLKAMNRSYTRERYLDVVRRLKDAIPGVALSTDIIVGFPGETEEDFEETLSLVEEARFSSAFTFIYSKRPGTPAAKIEDNTPREVIQERFDRLKHLVEDLAFEANQPDLGTDVEILVEGPSKRGAGAVMVGHSPKNQTVHFDLPSGLTEDDVIGKMCTVRVDEARTWYLRGQMCGEPR